MSTLRAAKWPNTISALRRSEERERANKQAEEEEARLLIDAEEAELRRQKRRGLIERANKRLYDETDRAKSFHSRLLLSDVLKEREAQIAYKAEVTRREREREERFAMQQRQQLEVAEQKELEAAQARLDKALKQRDIQDEQLNDLRATILAERAERMEVGRQMLEKDTHEHEIMRQEDEARRARAIAANVATRDANIALQRYKAAELARDVEADKQIEAFAQKKEAMMAERKKREVECVAEKVRIREAMAAKQMALLEKLKREREEREAQQADTKQKEQAAYDVMMNEYRRQERDAIDRSRAQQMTIKAARREHAKREDDHFVNEWSERTKRLAAEDAAEHQAKVSKAKALQAYHFKQIERKERRKMATKSQAMEEARITRQIIEDDQRMFENYTKVCMDEWAAQGKDLTPMMLEMTKKEKLSN